MGAGAGLAAAALAPTPALAHALDSSLERIAGLNSTLELQSRFSTGMPAAGAQVSLIAPDGTAVALGSTDAQGQLRFEVPAAADASWEVKVDQGPGHRDYLELPLEAAATTGPQLGQSLLRSLSRPDLLASGGGAALLVGLWVVLRRHEV
ncbi:MAG: hypothetical protein VKL97_01595 [Cyanobacteriota bacterium]|nr:hypothetical protein [Cyanobacteriota bacterium]